MEGKKRNINLSITTRSRLHNYVFIFYVGYPQMICLKQIKKITLNLSYTDLLKVGDRPNRLYKHQAAFYLNSGKNIFLTLKYLQPLVTLK